MRRACLLTALTFLLAACNGEDGDHGETHADDHAAHASKHGGVVVVLGDEEAHVELLVDHSVGKISLWSSDATMADLALDMPPVLNYVAADGPKQLVGVGVGNTWVFESELLKEEPKSARFRLVLAGKTYTPELEQDR